MRNHCSIEGCDRHAHGRGWSATHYRRWRINGDLHALRMPPDWTRKEIKLLMRAKLTPHTERFAGPDKSESLQAVADRLSRTLSACRTKRMRLERARGHVIGKQWTTQGLWTPEEDRLIRAHLAPAGERVPPGTWPRIAEELARDDSLVNRIGISLVG